jgi:hypothetical protein
MGWSYSRLRPPSTRSSPNVVDRHRSVETRRLGGPMAKRATPKHEIGLHGWESCFPHRAATPLTGCRFCTRRRHDAHMWVTRRCHRRGRGCSPGGYVTRARRTNRYTPSSART